MPKQFLTINKFHGGLNSSANPRSVPDGHVADGSIDFMVDVIGKIRLLGGTSTSGVPAANAAAIEAGYGLFSFSHDRVGAQSASTGAAQTGDSYLALVDSDGAADVDIYSDNASAWGTARVDLGSTSGVKAVFYIADGTLRIGDANFNNTNKWYGYIYRLHFVDSLGNALAPGGAQDLYDGWYVKNAEITKPAPVGTSFFQGKLQGTADASGSATVLDTDSPFLMENSLQADLEGMLVLDESGNQELTLGSGYKKDQDELNTPTRTAGNWDGVSWSIFPPPGNGFNISYEEASGSGNTIPAGTYVFGLSYIYDAEPGEVGYQESLVTAYSGSGANSANDGCLINTGKQVDISIFATSPYDSRLTGGRIYWRTRVGNTYSDYFHLFDVSLKNGVREGLSGDYTAWAFKDSSASNRCLYVDIDDIGTRSSVTWEDLNSMPENQETTTIQYKTAVVANRMVYAGNVKFNGIVYGDAIFKSGVNKFDTFSDTRKLEASVSDGDEIIKLETYADRLLTFKKNKLEIINISQDVEFIEETLMYKGVKHPASTFKTDFGIVWANIHGCFLYDGQRVSNLLEREGTRIISESQWATHAANNPLVGYFPKKRQIIVVDDVSNAGNGHIFLYDMVTRSWIRGNSAYPDVDKTNFVVNQNGDLILAHTDDQGTIVKWDDAADTSTAFAMTTKDLELGDPSRNKTIYKVYVTYQSGNSTTNVQVDYDTNGGTSFGYDFADGTNFSSTELAAANGWQVAELVPDDMAEARNIKSFRLRLATDGTVPAAFEISDITIIYRVKGVR
jgi:hypothetical protein